MTPFDWVLVTGATFVTVCAVWAFAIEWQERRRPVRGEDGRWLAPRRYHNGWGESVR